MIKVGRFLNLETLEEYAVFEMVEPKFYRIDFCNKDALDYFSINNIVYFSLYRKKKNFVYGDIEIYHSYLECINNANNIRESYKPPQIEREPRRIIHIFQKGNIEENFYQIKKVNGITEEEIYKFDNFRVDSVVRASTVLSELMPFNQQEYVSLEQEEKSSNVGNYLPLSTLKRMYPIDHIFNYDYEVEKNINKVQELVFSCIKTKRAAYDTETSGLAFNLYSDEYLAGFILSNKENFSRYLPTAHQKFSNLPENTFKDVLVELTNNNVDLISHNKKFERKILLKYGIDVPLKHCSLILSALLDSTIMKNQNSLKNLEEKRTGRFFLELKHIYPKGNIFFPELPEDLVKVYGCPDGDNTLQVFDWKWKQMESKYPFLRKLYEMECELADLKAEQEYYGMRVDTNYVLKASKVAKSNCENLRKCINALTRSEMDLNSPNVLRNYLYDVLKCKTTIRTKTGEASTSMAALKLLKSESRKEAVTVLTKDICERILIQDEKSKELIEKEGKPILRKEEINNAKYPFVHLLLKYREYNKQLTGFFDRINKNKIADRFFLWINQNGTDTGRQSSTMHQMAKSCRPSFLADSDDHDLIAADYSQVELRLFFYLAQELELLALAQDPDVDLHRAIGSRILNKEVYMISSEERNADKARNFGVVYMMSGRGLAVSKYGVGASKAQIKECTESIDKFFGTFKRCTKLMQDNALKASSQLYMETLFGRVRNFEELGDPNISAEKRAALIRKANNVPVQGLSADITKFSEVKIQRYIKEKGWDKKVETPQGMFPLVRCMLSIHDEVLISRHKSIPIERVFAMLISCMEIELSHTGFSKVPLFIGVHVGENWGDGKIDALEVPRGLMLDMIHNYEKTGETLLKTKDTRKEILGIINKYRDSELREYMEGLISEHGDSAEDLWDKVNHPSLTHELIARFPQSKDHKATPGRPIQLDRIQYAVERYLEFRLSGKDTIDNIELQLSPASEDYEDFDMKEDFKEMAGLHDYLVNDEDPEESEEVDDDYVMFVDDILEINKRTAAYTSDLLFMFDTCILDCSNLTIEQSNVALKMLWEQRVDTGFYRVDVLKDGEIKSAGFRIESADKRDKIDDYLLRCREENMKKFGGVRK